jgi:uncharacterized membrane protein YhaH (DUF805 family)
MLRRFFNEWKIVFLKIFDYKGKTDLKSCSYVFIFQLFMFMLAVILGLMIWFVYSELFITLFLIVLAYFILSLPAIIALMVRRLRDANTNVYQILIIPLSYLSIYLWMEIIAYQMDIIYQLLGFLIILFLSHFYVIVLLLLPSTKSENT